MIQSTRLRVLSGNATKRDGKYVLYWMQQSQRAEWNHALEYAIRQANELGMPTVVGFGIMDDYPGGNERHYAFMLEGLADTEVRLRQRGIILVVRRGHPVDVALELAREAALVVCDRGYLRHQRRWRDNLADRAGRRVVQVESDVVVPLEEASDKAEFAARTIRPKIGRGLGEYLRPVKPTLPKRDSLGLRLAAEPLAGLLGRLKIDRGVGPVAKSPGGTAAGRRRLERFIRQKLHGYSRQRSEPAGEGTSTLSPYLHFGQISALEVALRVSEAAAPKADRDAYLEQLIIRRELAANFVQFTPGYDRYESLPRWARQTLREHEGDKRAILYSRAELEDARTDDRYWNAAQREMVLSGYMHNSMRMYWGKKILEWSRTPADAYRTAVYLNDRYFLCGRDPNGYANIGWVFGLHDRPWTPRPIFGTVRYMNAAGLERKYDMEAYVRRVEALDQVSRAGAASAT